MDLIPEYSFKCKNKNKKRYPKLEKPILQWKIKPNIQSSNKYFLNTKTESQKFRNQKPKPKPKINLDKKIKALDIELDDKAYDLLLLNIKNDYHEVRSEINAPEQTYSMFKKKMKTITKDNNTIYFVNLLDNKPNISDILNHLCLIIEVYYPGIKAVVVNDTHNILNLEINPYDKLFLISEGLEFVNKLLVVGITTAYETAKANKIASCNPNSLLLSFDKIYELDEYCSKSFPNKKQLNWSYMKLGDFLEWNSVSIILNIILFF